MKKILLGTTAFLAASVAFAQAPTATVTGSFSTYLNSVGISAGTTGRQSADDAGWNVNQPASSNEVHFTAKGKTDAGLSYMGQIQHRFTNVTTDEAFIEFSDTWGKLQLGQNDTPAGDNHIGGQSAQSGTGGVNGFQSLSPTGSNRVVGVDASIAGDDAKVVYYLPTIAGLSVGVSLAPGGSPAATDAAPNPTGYRNALEASAQYSADLGGAKITIGGTHSQAKYNRGTNTNATPGQQEADFHNLRTFNVGAKVVVGALSVGLGHTNKGKGSVAKVLSTTGGTATNNGTMNTVGVSYDLGGGTNVGLGYGASKQGLVAGTSHKTSRSSALWSAGVTTAVAPGLSVYGEFNTISGTTGALTNGGFRGNEVIVGTSISF